MEEKGGKEERLRRDLGEDIPGGELPTITNISLAKSLHAHAGVGATAIVGLSK